MNAGTTPENDGAEAGIGPLEATLILARRGDARILPLLRKRLDEHPEIWRTTGNLALQAEASWLDMIAGGNLLLRESAARFAASLRDELAGPNPTPLEKLHVDRIVALHLQVQYLEAYFAQRGGELPERQQRDFDKRLDAAGRRLTDAMQGLARLRRLLPRVVEVKVSGQVEATVRERKPRAKGSRKPAAGCGAANRFADMLTSSRN